ncbi:hypothetical protein BDF22DRAFT_261084 [Syncephalis plumigaleata]|nr:hypothetical protein BDF22DRAFT_261084 [Syncephalis plumigaleata]
MGSSCKTIGEATDVLLDQLSQAGFPKVKLFIAHGEADSFLDLNDDYLVHPYHLPFLKYVLSSSTTFTMFTSMTGLIMPTIRIGRYRLLYYTAEQQSHPWNTMIYSAARLGYKWTFFALISLALLYAWIRVIAMAFMRILRFNFLTTSFLVTTAYCITLLIYFAKSTNPVTMDEVSYLYSVLARIPLNMILWHCRSAFSILRYRYFIASGVHNDLLYGIMIPSKYVIPLVNVVIFAGFIIWFSISTFKLRKHRKARSRFIQLVFFSVLGLIVQLIVFLIGINPQYTELYSKDLVYSLEIVLNVLHLMCALVFLAVMGVKWPKPDVESTIETRTPLGGMTTIGWTTTEGEEIYKDESACHDERTFNNGRKFEIE